MVVSHRTVFRYHPRFGYFFRANLHTWQPPQHPSAPIHLVATNGVGARCRWDPGRASMARRVLFIGCSLAAGDGVSNADRFTDMLETLIPGVEGHNYALSGSGHDQQLLIHREFAAMVGPDVLVLCPSLNCIGRNLLHSRLHRDSLMGGSILVPKPYFTAGNGGELVLHNVPVPKPEPRRRADERFTPRRPHWTRRLRAGVGTLLGRRARRHPVYDDPASEVYRLGHALLAQILRESTAAVKIVLPLLDVEYATHADLQNHHRFFTSLSDAAHARFVDMAAFFSRLSEAEARRGFAEHDGHYTRAGHEVIAAGLADVLRERIAAAS